MSLETTVLKLFLPNTPFLAPLKFQKTIGFLMCSGRSKGSTGKKKVNRFFSSKCLELKGPTFNNRYEIEEKGSNIKAKEKNSNLGKKD